MYIFRDCANDWLRREKDSLQACVEMEKRIREIMKFFQRGDRDLSS